LVSLSSERSGLQRRRTELERSVARYKSEQEILGTDIYMAVRDSILEDSLDEFVSRNERIDFEEFIRENDYVVLSPRSVGQLS